MSCIRSAPAKAAVWLTVDDFGSYKDQSGETLNVQRFTWGNIKNSTVQVSKYLISVAICDEEQVSNNITP